MTAAQFVDPSDSLALALVNTVSVVEGRLVDGFERQDQVLGWLTSRRGQLSALIGADVGDGALADAVSRVRALRNAGRQLTVSLVEDPRSFSLPGFADRDAAVRAVNLEAAAWLQIRWPSDGRPQSVLATQGGLTDLVVAALARDVVAMVTAPGGTRLRACLAPSCARFFWRRGRQQWCSPVCGNRARVSRHYERHHGHARIHQDRP